MKKPNAFIFDLDGTLIDSMGLWKQIDIDYLGKYDIQLPPTLQQEIEGLSFYDTAVYFKSHFPIPGSLEDIMAEWNEMSYHRYCHDVGLKPGVLEILQYAEAHKIPCAIATSNTIDLVHGVLQHNGVDSYFQAIVTSGEVGASKPAPDVFLEAAKRVGADPVKCLVFEDITVGIDGAHNAGMMAVAVDDVYSAYQMEEKKAKADFYIHSFTEIIPMIEA